MPTDMPPRGPITDALIARLTAELEPAVLVGDGARPPAAGWPGAQPGQGLFQASVLVETLEGVPGPAAETIRSRHSNWRAYYRLSTAGGARKQADDKADDVRAAALTLPRGEIVPGWELIDVVFTRQAAVDKQAPTDNPTFVVPDTVELWLTRQRA